MNIKPESEAGFTKAVLGLAKLYGWRACHFRPGMNRRGQWSTAVQGDGVGFPDLVLVRGKRVIWAELKSVTGKLSSYQEKWLLALKEAGQEVYVWRPEMWNEIVADLT